MFHTNFSTTASTEFIISPETSVRVSRGAFSCEGAGPVYVRWGVIAVVDCRLLCFGCGAWTVRNKLFSVMCGKIDIFVVSVWNIFAPRVYLCIYQV